MKNKRYIEIPRIRIPIWLPNLQGNWRAWLPSRGNVLFTLLVVSALFWAQSAGAFPLPAPTAPSTSMGTIAYQGRLADTSGVPLTGNYSMIFRLYNATTGSTPLWTEQWTGPNSVQVSDGLFNVMLGSMTSISPTLIASNSTLWLGITVGTDNEMLPRVQLGSVPFAVQALTVPDGSITQSKLAPDVNLLPPAGSITTTMIADGAVTTDKIANNDTEPSRVYSWTNDPELLFDAIGSGSINVISTNITITVPAGKAYYYSVYYTGIVGYAMAERAGSSSGFYGTWYAGLLSNSTLVGSPLRVVQTGYRQDWVNVGGSSYWNAPYSGSWFIRLGAGTHNLKVQFSGYSDNTMNKVHVAVQSLQVMRVY